jgi:hypothetical protein
MLVSHETPIPLLKESLSYNDYDYCLVHLLPTHSEYKNFYFESVKKGRHVLLDNSLFELGESYDPEQFAYWVKELKPAEYIIPDVFNDKEGTITSYEKFISQYGDLPGKKIAVVHGKTYEEFKECYEYFANTYNVQKIAFNFVDDYFINSYEDEILVSNLKIPNYWHSIPPNNWKKYALGRAMLIERLAKEGILKTYIKHHLLGATLPREFSLYFENSLDYYITTIDTSNPIVAGLLNKRYDEQFGLQEKWSIKLVDFIDEDADAEQLKNMFYNIFTFKKYIEKTQKGVII